MTDLGNAPSLIITKVFCINRFTVGAEARTIEIQSRSCHGIQLRLRGSTEYIIGNKHNRSRKNDLIYLPKGLKYTISSNEPGECLLLNFDTIGEYSLNARFLKPRLYGKFHELFERAIRESNDISPSSKTRSLSTVYSIVSLYQRTLECEYSSSRAIERLKPALDLIEFERNPSVEKLAAACNLSPAYFRYKFVATYGISPVQYMITSRINRAKRQLDLGESIKSVAEASGYNDFSYFSKVFKRETGMTPSEYISRELIDL